LLLATAELYERKLSSTAIAVYYEALKEYKWEDVRAALSCAISKKCKFFPKPAELVELIEGSLPDADVAWAALIEAIRRRGGYYSVIFDDPAISAAVEVGSWSGWTGLCEKSSAELHRAVKPEFLKLYKHFAQARKKLPVKVLPGLVEMDQKNKSGSAEDAPVFIALTGAFMHLTPGQKESFLALCRKRKGVERVPVLPGVLPESCSNGTALPEGHNPLALVDGTENKKQEIGGEE